MQIPVTDVSATLTVETNAAYHADSSHWGSSMIGTARESLSLAVARYVTKTLPSPKPSESMIVGTLFHAMVLEADTLANQFIIAPEVDRRTKEGKATWASFVESSDGREVVTDQQWQTAEAMTKSLRSERSIMALLEKRILCERSIRWNQDGLQAKCRPDALGEGGILLDLKSTRDPSPLAFAKSIANYGYHRQQPWYGLGLAAAGYPVEHYVLIACRNTAPYEVAAYQLGAESLRLGLSQMLETAGKLALLSEWNDPSEWRNSWQGGLSQIEIPAWEFKTEGGAV